MMFFTEKKFRSLSFVRKHYFAAACLKQLWLHSTKNLWLNYQKFSFWLNLPTLKNDPQSISQRYHLHLMHMDKITKETDLLPKVLTKDSIAKADFLHVTIYLENLRSAFNVGSIMRTTEAFRLGNIVFGNQTPDHHHPKVRETSMGTFDRVPCQKGLLTQLPRPYIALETVENGPTIWDFTFPSAFTLILGNEEFGVRQETIAQADCCVRIPLSGWKNSLNVASAFAIVAAQIDYQLRSKKTDKHQE